MNNFMNDFSDSFQTNIEEEEGEVKKKKKGQ